jgi:hypothetical protein
MSKREQVKHPSKIGEKHPNSKFARGSKSYEQRRVLLAKINERVIAGKSFADLQVGLGSAVAAA